jgi:hypothetical protein
MTHRTTILSLVLVLAAGASARGAGVAPFLRELPPLERCTEAHAVRAAAVLIGERQNIEDATHCEAKVRAAGLLKPNDYYTPTAELKKGFAAMLFARGMRLDGGWAGRVFGMKKRYGYKELEFLNMVPPMGERDPMTGNELLSLLRNAQDHVKQDAADKAHLRDYKKKRRERYGHGPK